jgi:SAM-dependent methyltransferase
MASYALLVRPAANRVFGGDAAALLRSELAVLDRFVLGGVLRGMAPIELSALEYVGFDADPHDLLPFVVASASSTYALYERVDELLRPVRLPSVERYDDDLVTTQRYVGKTNETFTRLLVNVAVAAGGAFTRLVTSNVRVRVLDPLCGRGTTLNQALLLGADALGIDVDANDTHAYATFLTTWMQEKRIKHQVDGTAGRRRFRVAIGPKGAAGADERRVVDVVTADTSDATTLFGRSSVDAIAADLPYGVQHGARAGGETGRLSRRPDELLADALPAWLAVLRPGGGMALSWNTRVLPRSDLVAMLADAGFDVPDLGDDVDFAHRVDRMITRDVALARRPD